MNETKALTPLRHAIPVALLLAIAACASPVATAILGPPDASRTVLIASESSDFKKDIVQKVGDELAGAGWQVKTLPLEALAQENTRNADAILIINGVKAWQVSRETQQFLEKAGRRERQRVFVFSTSWNPNYTQKLPEGIDGITSASNMEKTDTLAKTITERIREKIEQ